VGMCHKWFSRVRRYYKSWHKLQRVGATWLKDSQKRRNVSGVDTDIILLTALHSLLKSHRNKDDCESEKKGLELNWRSPLLLVVTLPELSLSCLIILYYLSIIKLK
jgi:hypothetical protein